MDCAAEVVPPGLVVVDSLLDPTVDVPRPAAEELDSGTVLLLVAVAVGRDGAVVSRLELRGGEEGVAEVAVDPEAEVDIWSRTMVGTDVNSAAAVVTWERESVLA